MGEEILKYLATTEAWQKKTTFTIPPAY